jgi:hypothetical protein
MKKYLLLFVIIVSCNCRKETWIGTAVATDTRMPPKQSRHYYVTVRREDGEEKEFQIDYDFYNNIDIGETLIFKP